MNRLGLLSANLPTGRVDNLDATESRTPRAAESPFRALLGLVTETSAQARADGRTTGPETTVAAGMQTFAFAQGAHQHATCDDAEAMTGSLKVTELVVPSDVEADPTPCADACDDEANADAFSPDFSSITAHERAHEHLDPMAPSDLVQQLEARVSVTLPREAPAQSVASTLSSATSSATPPVAGAVATTAIATGATAAGSTTVVHADTSTMTRSGTMSPSNQEFGYASERVQSRAATSTRTSTQAQADAPQQTDASSPRRSGLRHAFTLAEERLMAQTLGANPRGATDSTTTPVAGRQPSDAFAAGSTLTAASSASIASHRPRAIDGLTTAPTTAAVALPQGVASNAAPAPASGTTSGAHDDLTSMSGAHDGLMSGVHRPAPVTPSTIPSRETPGAIDTTVVFSQHGESSSVHATEPVSTDTIVEPQLRTMPSDARTTARGADATTTEQTLAAGATAQVSARVPAQIPARIARAFGRDEQPSHGATPSTVALEPSTMSSAGVLGHDRAAAQKASLSLDVAIPNERDATAPDHGPSGAIDLRVDTPTGSFASASSESLAASAPSLTSQGADDVELTSMHDPRLDLDIARLRAGQAKMSVDIHGERLELHVATEGAQVHVRAHTTSAALGDALLGNAAELRSALEQHALDLGEFSYEPSGGQRESSADQPGSRHPSHETHDTRPTAAAKSADATPTTPNKRNGVRVLA